MQPEQTNQYTPYLPQSDGQRRRSKIILLAVAAAVLLIVLGLFTLLTSKSTVVVNVQSNRQSEITYRFVSQADPEAVTEIKNTAKRMEVKLPKGSYELTVRQDETSYFAIVESGGETDTVNAAPEPERGRRFIGNQPKSCTHLLADRLISYDCGDAIGTLQTHVAATANQPTYARPHPFPTDDVIEGIIKTREGSILLMYEAEVAGHEEFAEEAGGGHSPHVAFTLVDGSKLKFENRTSLGDLGEKDIFSFTPYREGFMAYDKTFTKAFYYASLEAKAEELSISQPRNSDLLPYALTAQGTSFAVAYSKDKGENPEADSEVVIQDGDQTRHHDFKKTFRSIRLCGDKKLCGLSDNVLDVYDVSGEEARLLYTVGNTRAIDAFDAGLIVARDKETLVLDVNSRAGRVQYSFGDYGFCGIQPAGDTYLLCVTNSRDARSLLYVEQQQASDDIDKKVAQLLELNEVSSVSAYGRFITISPNAGEVKYQKELDNFGYDPKVLQTVNTRIKQKLDELGIDKKYQVKNTLE